jgi:hypothetical protein
LWQASAALAAIGGKKGKQFVHDRVIGEVVDEPAFLPPLYQANSAQMRKVERKRRCRNVELLTDCARAHAFAPGLHEQPIDRQARLVSQRSQTLGCGRYFHISIIIEVLTDVNPAWRPAWRKCFMTAIRIREPRTSVASGVIDLEEREPLRLGNSPSCQ